MTKSTLWMEEAKEEILFSVMQVTLTLHPGPGLWGPLLSLIKLVLGGMRCENWLCRARVQGDHMMIFPGLLPVGPSV